MSLPLTPVPKPKTSCVFHVVVKTRGIYAPMASVMEMPPDEESWSDVNGIWVADRTHLIYQFLAKKDPKSRCKLQAEVDLAIEQNTEHPCWFRDGAEKISNGPNTVLPGIREKAMQAPESIRYPYTTFGITNCLEGHGTPGVEGDDVFFAMKPHFWTRHSLKSFIEADSKYTMIVFDITDLNNIAYLVLARTRDGRCELTMKDYCGYEHGEAGTMASVVSLFDRIPVIESEMVQLFLGINYLNQSVTVPDATTISSIFMRYKWLMFDPIHNTTTVDDVFGGDVRLASIAELTCEEITEVVKAASNLVSLSISSKALQHATNKELDLLVRALDTQLSSLAVVYIAEPVIPPGKYMLGAFQQSVMAQARFFERVRRHRGNALLKIVLGSSMYSLTMNEELAESLAASVYKVMLDKALEHPEWTQEHSIIGRDAPALWRGTGKTKIEGPGTRFVAWQPRVD
ncbi:hypothetical protein NHJ13734_007438 [Beauveria thailandica]